MSKCSICVPNESDLSMKHLRTVRARLQQMRYYFSRIVSGTQRDVEHSREMFVWIFIQTRVATRVRAPFERIVCLTEQIGEKVESYWRNIF